MADSKSNKNPTEGYQFGTFKGVFTPSILTILGVIMYLRFGWALGNVGLVPTLVIITLASGITFITGLSLSALATNMRVAGGGSYYIISRSLGIEAGAAVGLPLFFAQALGISFYVLGFSESLVAEYPGVAVRLAEAIRLPEALVGYCSQHEAQAIGVIVLLVLTGLAAKSADLVLKSQFVIMTIMIVSLVSFFLGSSSNVDVTAIPGQLLTRKGFWPVFAVIFPAVTGIEAGIAMSGDLKDSARSLPRGTISAVLGGYVVYLAMIIFLWSTVRDPDLLATNPMIVRYVARWGGAILLGIWAASLSSAMGVLLGSPRTLQALAKDRVIPLLFGRGFGKRGEPRIATATAFTVGLAGILLGDLNAIAPVLSMFFLTSYGLLNISAGLEELTSPPSWRPKFRIPWALSLFGAFGCFAAMFMIHAGATFLAGFVAMTVYFIMRRRSLKAWWGDMRGGVLMLIARNVIHALARRRPDSKTWQPNILALSGSPTSRWHLVELANAISQGRSFLTIGTIVPSDTSADRVESISSSVKEYLDRRDVQALVKVFPAETPLQGACTLASAYGYGPIAPNTILLGMTERPEHYDQFARLIKLVSSRRQNLVVVRDSEESSTGRENGRVDVWWYGAQQNLGLMLALIYLLRRSPAWRSTELVLKTIIDDPSKADDARKRLDSFISKVRLDARCEIISRDSKDIFEDIRRHSEGTDLVLLGMRAPEDDERLEDYCSYYESLLLKTEGLPPTAFVLASEDVDFLGIFQDS